MVEVVGKHVVFTNYNNLRYWFPIHVFLKVDKLAETTVPVFGICASHSAARFVREKCLRGGVAETPPTSTSPSSSPIPAPNLPGRGSAIRPLSARMEKVELLQRSIAVGLGINRGEPRTGMEISSIGKLSWDDPGIVMDTKRRGISLHVSSFDLRRKQLRCN